MGKHHSLLGRKGNILFQTYLWSINKSLQILSGFEVEVFDPCFRQIILHTVLCFDGSYILLEEKITAGHNIEYERQFWNKKIGDIDKLEKKFQQNSGQHVLTDYASSGH